MDKYPDLFYENESGQRECPCGAWVPPGWESIVDDLCGAITRYTKHTYCLDHDVISKKYYIWRWIGKALDWTHQKFIKIFPRFNKKQYNKPFYSFVEKFRQRSYKCVKYKTVYPPSVKIDQIKEKYGELRFYTSGGDKQVQGMILFAEYLCNKTCQNTGVKGIKCSKGCWLATLCESEMKRLEYQII